MKVFRFSKAKYCVDLSGIGASLYPGRWNRSGRKIIYSAGSRALALVEITVHLPSGIIPKDYFLIDLERRRNRYFFDYFPFSVSFHPQSEQYPFLCLSFLVLVEFAVH